MKASLFARARLRVCVSLFAIVVAFGCAHKPPTIVTPLGAAQFNADQIIGHLQTVVHLVSAANNAIPPRVSNDDATLILTALRAAVRTVEASPMGGRAAALSGWEAVKAGMTPDQRTRNALYIGMVDVLLIEVIR